MEFFLCGGMGGGSVGPKHTRYIVHPKTLFILESLLDDLDDYLVSRLCFPIGL